MAYTTTIRRTAMTGPRRRQQKSTKPTKQQQTPLPGTCSHHTPTRSESTLTKLYICKQKARRRLDASKRGLTQQQPSVIKSVVNNPSNNKIQNPALFVITTRQQANQLQLSFRDVNTKPEGYWMPANVGRHNSRPAL